MAANYNNVKKMTTFLQWSSVSLIYNYTCYYTYYTVTALLSFTFKTFPVARRLFHGKLILKHFILCIGKQLLY